MGAPARIDPPAADETTVQQGMISGFLGGLHVEQLKTTRIFETHVHLCRPRVCGARGNNAGGVPAHRPVEGPAGGEATQEATDYLSKELEAQRQRLNDSENKLAQYKLDHNAVGLDEDEKVNTVSSALADISASYTKAKLERIEKEAVYEGLKAIQGDRDRLAAHPSVLASPDIQLLKTSLNQLQAEKAKDVVHTAEYFKTHNDIFIENAQAKLYQAEDRVVEAAKNEAELASGKEASFKDQLDRQNAETLSLDRKGVDYGMLQREEASVTRCCSTILLARTKETGVSGQFKGTNITIIDAAEICQRIAVIAEHEPRPHGGVLVEGSMCWPSVWPLDSSISNSRISDTG